MIIYQETQHYPHWMRWVPLGSAIMAVVLFTALTLNGDIPFNEMIIALALLLVAQILMYVYFVSERMTLKLSEQELNIKFRYFRFLNHRFLLSDISEISQSKSNTLNVGYYWSPFKRRELKMHGQKGIKIILNNGKEFFITSLRPQRLYDHLQKVTEHGKETETDSFTY